MSYQSTIDKLKNVIIELQYKIESLEDKIYVRERPKPNDLIIEKIPMSRRLYRILKFMEVERLGVLEYVTDSQMLRVPNLGRVSLKELKNVMEKNGMKLGCRSDEKDKKPKQFI